MVTLEIERGIPKVSIPLPSTNKHCLFALRPHKNTIGDLMTMLKKEDPAIGVVTISTKGGVQMASSNSIEDLIEDDFKMTINNKQYYVKIPDRQDKKVDLEKLADIRLMVNQLYSVLNVPNYLVNREKEIEEQLIEITKELEPLEKARRELDMQAQRKTNLLAWGGLGYMSIQFGILARLTWWEYSWDIMEPVTYFVTYGTTMAAYAYYVLTKQEYILPEVSDRQHLLEVHQRAKKIGLDLDHYNKLKATVAQLESDLRRIRDPLLPYIPPSPKPTKVVLITKSTTFSRTKENIFSFLKSIIKIGGKGKVPSK
ncbi:mitochondrial calcium uniporter isoform X2 [Rhodnius prolixus]